MADPAYKLDRRYTYRDYLGWTEAERWELINGEAWAMSPAPSRRHQAIFRVLMRLFANFLEGKPCLLYGAPFDVLLPAHADQLDDEVDTVVQPDIVVVCDRSRLTDYGLRGAPDLVVEIVSPWTSKRDLKDKFELYERHGVREYWLVFPDGEYLHRYLIVEGGRFGSAEILVKTGILRCSVLEGLTIEVAELFSAE